jgi:hypothetical protein
MGVEEGKNPVAFHSGPLGFLPRNSYARAAVKLAIPEADYETALSYEEFAEQEEKFFRNYVIPGRIPSDAIVLRRYDPDRKKVYHTYKRPGSEGEYDVNTNERIVPGTEFWTNVGMGAVSAALWLNSTFWAGLSGAKYVYSHSGELLPAVKAKMREEYDRFILGKPDIDGMIPEEQDGSTYFRNRHLDSNRPNPL